jgi:hypothetical protein
MQESHWYVCVYFYFYLYVYFYVRVRVRVRVRVVEALGRSIFADIALAVALGTMGISKIQSGSTTGMNAISSFSI